MTALTILIALAIGVNGLLSGFSFEIALVKLPTRHRIGSIAYANFARGSDMGNGLIVYPTVAIAAAILTIVATIVGYLAHAPVALLTALSLATLGSVAHFIATSRAAPTMLQVGKTPDDATLLAALLDRFARWHAVRATLQVLTFFLLIWALVAAR